jgi:signal transduction histidine kinase/ligand-binding sensor domain-containing protein
MTIRASVIFMLLVFCLWHDVSAQYRFDSWTTDDGLPQNGVRKISQSRDGYLWFTTFDGLVRFDGVKFTVFNKSNSEGIINNRFWVVYGADDGSVWAGTEGGDLTIYRNGVFTSYPTSEVPDDRILDFIPDSNGEILIETISAYYYLRDGKIVPAKSRGDNSRSKVTFDGRSGAVWTITPSETQRRFNSQTVNYALNVQNVNPFLENFYEDRRGGLWIGDIRGLYYINEGRVIDYSKTESFLKNTYPHRFWEEDDGSLWFATGDFNFPGVGLVRFMDGKFTTVGIEQGLSNDRIFEVFKDREGAIWVATNRGLNQLRRQIVTTLSKKDGLAENEVYPILKAGDGSIYVGSVNGLSRYKDKNFNRVSLPMRELNTTTAIQSLAEDSNGRIWIGTVSGVFVIENGVAKDVTKSLNDYPFPIFTIHPDRQGNVWFGTEFNGVIKYRDGKIISEYSIHEGLAGNDVKVIHEAKDNKLWFGTYGGLSVAECGSENSGCKFSNFTMANGLGSNFIRSIKEDDDGTFWIGTYDGGLSRFKEGKFFTFDTQNGLYNNGVFAIVEDKRGNFWMSSNNGIFRASKQQLNDYADGKIKSYDSFGYGRKDGMLSAECNGGRQPAAITDDKGQIWFPTVEGVAIVDPDLLKMNNLPPPIDIDEILLDRQKIPFTDTLDVQPSQTYLDISYTALSLINSEKILFKYKLEGFDEDWVEARTRRTVNYSHLPPGNYIFRVTATSSDGVWNPEGKSLRINVLAPFYQTRWFIVSIIFAAFFVVFLIYRYRIEQFRRINTAKAAFSRQLIESQEAERKRIAQELHDSLGQNLLVIKNRAVMGLNAKGNEITDEQFGEIHESVSDALIEVRSITSNLRPIHIDRLGLTSTIEDMAEAIEKSSGIEIKCDIENIDGLFSKEDEINFYRIVQEGLSNIVKHSNATGAGIEVFREDQRLYLNIRDNGEGFDGEAIAERMGLGLNGIEERTKILRGTHSIYSEVGKGTRVSVEIELSK